MTQTYQGHPVHDDVTLYVDAHSDNEEEQVLGLWKAGEDLGPRERAILNAWTTRKNLDAALKFLDGKDYRAAFGFDTLDQVHGQSWSPDVCGCTIHQVWDHRLRDAAPNEIVHHAHRLHTLCDRHAPLVGPDDHAAHHERLLAECRHKESVLTAVTEAHGLQPHERPAWRYNADHELVIDTTAHPVLRPHHVNRVVEEQFPKSVVHVR